MIPHTPNRTPPGQACGNCLFALTHTHALLPSVALTVICRRFPPTRIGQEPKNVALGPQLADSMFPVNLWDGWCGEWKARLPLTQEEIDAEAERQANQ